MDNVASYKGLYVDAEVLSDKVPCTTELLKVQVITLDEKLRHLLCAIYSSLDHGFWNDIELWFMDVLVGLVAVPITHVQEYKSKKVSTKSVDGETAIAVCLKSTLYLNGGGFFRIRVDSHKVVAARNAGALKVGIDCLQSIPCTKHTAPSVGTSVFNGLLLIDKPSYNYI